MSTSTLDLLTQTDAREEEAHRESGLKDMVLLKKLWPFMRPHKKPILGAFLLLPLVLLTQMAQPFILRRAIDGPIATGDLNGLYAWVGLFLGFLLAHYGIRYIQMYLAQMSGQRVIRTLRVELYAHLQRLSPGFYHNTPIGKLVTRVTGDIENLNEMLSTGGFAILTDLALIGGAIIGMLVMEWRLALLAIGTMVLLLLMMEYFRARSRRAYDEIRVKVARMNAFLQENIVGMDLVQLYRREPTNYQAFEQLNRSNLKSGLDSIFYSTAFNALVELMTYITMVVVLWYGGNAILDGAMTFGALVAFFQFTNMMFEPIEDVSEKYTVLQSGLASIDKVMALFNRQPDIVDLPDAVAIPECRGEIRYEGVTFAYQPGKTILHGVDLTVRPGEKIALVGPSGAGKTTLVKLLLRFYDLSDAPTCGRILLDRQDVRRVRLSDLRRHIVSIQQDDFLFSRSVAENIALAPPEQIDRARLEAAARQVNIWPLVERLPDGLDTVLQERGANISTGEKQLLLFARAIYHDPSVLVLDEATSAIDPQTEDRIQEALDRLMVGRTGLVIAHRLSTIRQADRILVVEGGRIVEQGSHEELLRQAGVYARFYQYQELLAERI